MPNWQKSKMSPAWRGGQNVSDYDCNNCSCGRLATMTYYLREHGSVTSTSWDDFLAVWYLPLQLCGNLADQIFYLPRKAPSQSVGARRAALQKSRRLLCFRDDLPAHLASAV